MKCMYCESEMTKANVPFHIDRKGIHITFDDIPAWVCTQCGEPYFEENQVNSMQEIIKVIEEQRRGFAKTG